MAYNFNKRREFRGGGKRNQYGQVITLGDNSTVKQEVGTNTDTTKSDSNNERPAKSTRRAGEINGVKQNMGYPIARGPDDNTGDALLIKCIEYVPPKTGLEVSTSRAYAGADGSFEGRNYVAGQKLQTEVSPGQFEDLKVVDSVRIKNDGASDRQKDAKAIYYITLPIPQDVNDSNIVTWGDDTMNIFQLAGVAAAANFVERPGATFQQGLDFIQKGIDLGGAIDSKLQTAIRNAIAGAAVNQLGGNVNAQNLIARTTGQVLNSNLELLFGGVNLRSFPFSITFTPRYEEEALEVKRIIRQFKMSMAAKAGKRFSGGSASGIFLNSPDVFSLRYMHNGQDHPFLNSFKICALTGMSVNYTNAGTYASYGDGSPVSIRLNMTFKELNPVYSEDYDGMTDDMGVGY